MTTAFDVGNPDEPGAVGERSLQLGSDGIAVLDLEVELARGLAQSDLHSHL